MHQSLQKLSRWFSSFPGVGLKSAQKLAFHLVEMKEEDLQTFLGAIQEVRQEIKLCARCHNYSNKSPCLSCETPFQGEGILCITESPKDTLSLKPHLPKETKFFSLDGKLSPLEGIHPENLNLSFLSDLIEKEGLKEIIIALSSDMEGEATAQYLKDNYFRPEFKVTRIAFGLPVGHTLALTDSRSLRKSLSGRTTF